MYRQAISSGPLELTLLVSCLVHLSRNLRLEDEDEGILVRAAFRKRCKIVVSDIRGGGGGGGKALPMCLWQRIFLEVWGGHQCPFYPPSPVSNCIVFFGLLQNVMLQMGLNVISVDGMRIKQLRTYAMKCKACFK